jgi:hypothetical protein
VRAAKDSNFAAYDGKAQKYGLVQYSMGTTCSAAVNDVVFSYLTTSLASSHTALVVGNALFCCSTQLIFAKVGLMTQ